jgi:hypothetical protein
MESAEDVTAAKEPWDWRQLLQASKADALELTERERLVLDLWDREKELELEMSLLEAQNACESFCARDMWCALSYLYIIVISRSNTRHLRHVR